MFFPFITARAHSGRASGLWLTAGLLSLSLLLSALCFAPSSGITAPRSMGEPLKFAPPPVDLPPDAQAPAPVAPERPAQRQPVERPQRRAVERPSMQRQQPGSAQEARTAPRTEFRQEAPAEPLTLPAPPVSTEPAVPTEPAPPAGSVAEPGSASGTSAPAAPGIPAAPQALPPPVRLFGTVEFRALLKNLPKWERVRDLEVKSPTFGKNEQAAMGADVAARWQQARDSVKDAPLMDKVKAVNQFFNRWPYKTDMVNWGIEDYWTTPAEFLRKSGDCEDYAITKYYALRNLGVPANRLRVVALMDTIRGIGHAVCVVITDDDAYVLDNLTNMLLSHKKLTHYDPQFSVNEEFMWRHIKPQKGPGK